jgi:hypothetical protein
MHTQRPEDKNERCCKLNRPAAQPTGRWVELAATLTLQARQCKQCALPNLLEDVFSKAIMDFQCFLRSPYIRLIKPYFRYYGWIYLFQQQVFWRHADGPQEGLKPSLYSCCKSL